MDTILPYLLSLLVATACFSAKIWHFIDEPTSTDVRRVNTVDGLRGYLALSVMLSHAYVARAWLITGAWTLPADPFLSQLGSVAVSLFFMITGYLFWGKLVSSDGRVDWAKLYVGRIFRIAPVYLIAATGLVLVVFWRTGFTLHVPVGSVINDVLHWYGLGFLIGHDFNGYANVWIILAGVVWTLKYEWRFYFALLPLSLVAKRKIHLPAALTVLAGAIVGVHAGSSDSWSYWVLFAIGMVVASLRSVGLQLRIPNGLASLMVVATFATVFVRHPSLFSTEQALLLGIVFLLVCNGATVFGALTTDAAIRLGHASYGIYLLQGFVFSVGFDNPFVKPIVTEGISQFWIITLVGMLILCCVAAFLYAIVERPMITLGRRVGANASFGIRVGIGRLKRQS